MPGRRRVPRLHRVPAARAGWAASVVHLRRWGWIAAGLVALPGLASPTPAEGQDVSREIRQSQARLEQIRKEREDLQREMEALRSRVRDASREVANIEAQVATSALALAELDYQTAVLGTNADSTHSQLVRASERLKERNAVLHHRLRSIYKQGPLHAVRVLLSAESFGDLLNRYKYLHLVTLYDRVLLENVSTLEADLLEKEAELERSLTALEVLREEKMEEVSRLERLENEAKQALTAYRREGQRTEDRLATLEADERRLRDAVAELERKRLEEERRRTVAGETRAEEGSISTRDLASLDWPVEGELVYRFGPERRPNGVVLRWNGIGIKAPLGTPVRSVEEGIIVHAGPTEGYGQSVWISHGGGYYTLYLHLESVSVRVNQRVEGRQVIGTVGGASTPEGPHLEFQVRMPLRGGMPEAVDPLGWLRSRGR